MIAVLASVGDAASEMRPVPAHHVARVPQFSFAQLSHLNISALVCISARQGFETVSSHGGHNLDGVNLHLHVLSVIFKIPEIWRSLHLRLNFEWTAETFGIMCGAATNEDCLVVSTFSEAEQKR